MTHPLHVCVSVCVGVCECLQVCPCMCQISISMTGGGVLQYVGRCLRTNRITHKKMKTHTQTWLSEEQLKGQETSDLWRKPDTTGYRTKGQGVRYIKRAKLLSNFTFSVLLLHQVDFRFNLMICTTLCCATKAKWGSDVWLAHGYSSPTTSGVIDS